MNIGGSDDHAITFAIDKRFVQPDKISLVPGEEIRSRQNVGSPDLHHSHYKLYLFRLARCILLRGKLTF
jgi:hypothetical protein